MVLPIFKGVKPTAPLKTETSSTFDPLGVATILPNPRATSSAIRLYTQWPPYSCRWPHLMQIGGTLTPLGVLTEHLLTLNHSVHPAESMALQTAVRWQVRSTTVFKDYPIDFSNLWIADASNFAPSRSANNDILVINIEKYNKTDEPIKRELSGAQRRSEACFTMFGIFIGIVLLGCLILSVLLVDIWAAVLFLIYWNHWAASTLISFTRMIGPRPPSAPIKADNTASFAVYERTGGGTIVFKGSKQAFEKWYRQTWQFNATAWNQWLHWAWILTGTLAAVGSTAAMVNMRADLQLAFLGILVICSLSELVITRLVRDLEVQPHLPYIQLFDNSNYRTEAIIRTVLEAKEMCRLNGLDWISLGLLPNLKEFSEMFVMLDKLHALRGVADEAAIDAVIESYMQATGAAPGSLGARIAGEAKRWAAPCLMANRIDRRKVEATVTEEKRGQLG